MNRKLPFVPKRIVIKVGSQLLVDEQGLRQSFIDGIAQQIHELRTQGLECLLVSSGAIAYGKKYLSTSTIVSLAEKQAAAAVGQTRLMHAYEKTFGHWDIVTAQILLTRDDILAEQRYHNARQTLECLIQQKVLAIINENDTVSVDEIKFGDNDILASLIAQLIHADALILLSNVEGLLDQNSHRVSVAHITDPNLVQLIRPEKSSLGTGGMQSKLIAAENVANMQKVTFVANGNTPNILIKILGEEDMGTLFLP